MLAATQGLRKVFPEPHDDSHVLTIVRWRPDGVKAPAIGARAEGHLDLCLKCLISEHSWTLPDYLSPSYSRAHTRKMGSSSSSKYFFTLYSTPISGERADHDQSFLHRVTGLLIKVFQASRTTLF